MILALSLIFLALGLIIGSFLNVVIFRFNTGRSFGGRSGCMTCEKKLSWHELIPLFSYIGLRGRCSKCKSKISAQYPIVEALTGIIFAGIFLKFQDLFFLDTFAFSISYAFYATMFSVLLVVAVYDFKHKIIPDAFSLAFGIITFIGLFFFKDFIFYPHIPPVSEFLAGVLLAIPFFLLWLVSKGKWMGLGDGKLALGLGWLLGFSRLLSGVVLAFWSGAIIGVLLMIFSKKHHMKSEIPFAPFLVLGVLLSFFLQLEFFGTGF